MEIVLYTIAITIVLVAAGIIIGRMIYAEHPLGNLRVDRSDPRAEPYLFLELDTDVYTIMHKKHVTFRVKIEDFISHK